MIFPLTSAGLVNCEKTTGSVAAGTTYLNGFAVGPNGKLQVDDSAVSGAVYNAGIACKPNGVVYVTTGAPTRWVGGIPLNDVGAVCVTQGGTPAAGAGGSPISSAGGLCIPTGVLTDVTAPTLSSASAGTATTDGATGAGVTTNEGNGTLYWAVVTNGGSCTDAQLKAGSGGNIVAGKAGSQAVTTTGAQTISTITGLTSSTTYQIKYLQRDAAGNDSSQASVSLTTSAAGFGSHQYWRLKNFTGTTASYFETCEVQLLEGATIRSGGVTPTASTAPASGAGTLPYLTNGILDDSPNQTYWTTAVANTLTLTFNLGASYPIDGAKIARYNTAGRFPTSCVLEYSDDGSSWTTAGTGTPVQPGSNFTLSSTIAFA